MTLTTGEKDTSSNSFLIEKDGVREWKTSIEGYVGWTILKQGPGAKPKDHHTFIDGEWVEDTPRKLAAARWAKFAEMDREQLVDFLLDIIKKGDARLDKLEAQVAALNLRLPSP